MAITFPDTHQIATEVHTAFLAAASERGPVRDLLLGLGWRSERGRWVHPGVRASTRARPATALPQAGARSQPERSPLLTEAQLCTHFHISREAALKLRHDPLDPIPCMKVGRRYLYDPARVMKWAERQAARARPRSGPRRGR